LEKLSGEKGHFDRWGVGGPQKKRRTGGQSIYKKGGRVGCKQIGGKRGLDSREGSAKTYGGSKKGSVPPRYYSEEGREGSLGCT